MPPLLYIALAPDLVQELELAAELQRLAGRTDIESWPGPGAPTLEALAGAGTRAQILLTGWRVPSLQAILQDWSPERFALRLVAHSAGTVKQLLPVQAVARGLLVTHANDALAQAVAEFTVGLMLTQRRWLVASAQRMKSGQPRVPVAQLHELAGSTVGVIGASRIGRRVIELLRPFDVSVLVCDPYCPPAWAAQWGARLVGLRELLQSSDIVSLHAPVTAETIGMLGAAEFAAMRAGALFINTARGRLIDPGALLRELQTGRLDAILDVTDPDEPLPAGSPFFALENCLILPHMAAVTIETRRRQSRISVDEILRYLDGRPLLYPVPPDRWDLIA